MQSLLDCDTDCIDLDKAYYKELMYFYRTNPTVKHCVDTLEKFLFSNLEVKGAKPVLQDYIAEYIVPFFRQVLKHSVILGWVAYRTRKVIDVRTNKQIKVPEVVPLDYSNVHLTVNKVTFEYKIMCTSIGGFEQIQDVHFLLFSDMQRLASNSLIDSVLDTIMGDHRYAEQIKRFTMQAEFVRSNPTIYLRKVPGNTGDGAAAAATGNMRRTVGIANVRSVADRIQQRMPRSQEMLERASEDMVSNVEFHNNQVMELNTRVYNNYYSMGLGLRQQYENNIYICPPNTELAAPPRLPESRLDQLSIERALTSKIYTAFGIPETISGFGSSASSSLHSSSTRASKVRKDVNIMDIITFEATLERFRNFFSDSFVYIYKEIFNKILDRKTIMFHTPRFYDEFMASTIYSEAPEVLESKDEDSKKRTIEEVDDNADDEEEEIPKKSKTSI